MLRVAARAAADRSGGLHARVAAPRRRLRLRKPSLRRQTARSGCRRGAGAAATSGLRVGGVQRIENVTNASYSHIALLVLVKMFWKGAVGNIPTPREGSSPMPPTHSPPRWHSPPRYRCPPPQPQLQRVALRVRGRRAWGSPTTTAQTAAPARAANSRGAGSQTGTKTRNPRPRARYCSSGWHRKSGRR